MKHLIALVISGLTSLGASTVNPNQIRPCQGAANFVIMTVNSKTICAQIDPASFIVDTSTNPPTLRAIIPSSPLPTFITGETPSGTVDGTNSSFGLAATPLAGSLILYRNGIRQQLGGDYTLVGSTINFLTASIPQSSDILLADYRK